MQTIASRILAICTCMLLLAASATAQIIPTTEQYFVDDSLEGFSTVVHSSQRWGDKILIGGRYPNEHSPASPYLALLDTTGAVVWKMDSTIVCLTIHLIQIMSDTEAIAIVRLPANVTEMWKVHLPTGQLKWKARVPLGGFVEEIEPISPSRFAIGMTFSAPSPYFFAMALIDMQDGDTIRTRPMGQGAGFNNRIPILHDGAANLYCATNNTLVKLDTNIIAAPQWQVTHPLTAFRYIEQLSLDSLGRMTCMGYDNPAPSHMSIAQVNTATGALLWNVKTPNLVDDHEYQDHIERGDYLYTAWRHRVVGANVPRHAITKVNKATQAFEWTVYYQPTGAGMSTPPPSDQNGIRDFDIDHAGNLYTTGYYNAANFGPGAWILTKVDGNNGSVLWEKTITDSTHIYDQQSDGIGIHAIQGSIYAIGKAQHFSKAYTTNTKTLIQFTKLQPSGNTLARVYPGRTMQYPSRTIELKPYRDTCTIALLQAGHHAKLRLLDYSQNTIWERILPVPADQWNRAIDLHVSTDTNIYVITEPGSPVDTLPFLVPGGYREPRIYTVDGNGNILRTDTLFSSNGGSTTPVKIIHDGTSIYVLDYPANHQRMVKITNGILTSATNNFINYEAIYGQSDYFQLPTPGILMVPSKQAFPGWCHLAWHNSSTFAYLGQCSISANLLEFVRHSQVANGKVYICGKGLNGSDYLAAIVPGATTPTWSMQYSTSSDITKFDLDSAAQYIYTAGTITAGPSKHLQLRKVNASTGALVWTRTWQKAGSATITPQVVHFEDDDQRLWITGYRDTIGAPGIQSTWIRVYDPSGNPLDSLFRTGNPPGKHDIPTLAPAPYGNIIAGGALFHQPQGKTGFYWGLDTANVNCNAIFSASITGISAPAYCQGQAIAIQSTGSNAPTTQWLLNGNPISTQPAITLNLTSTGTQNLTLITTNGTCTDTATAQFTVHPAPLATISPAGPISLCAGDTATLAAPPAMQYQWLRNGTAIPGATSASLLATLAGTYTLILTDPGTGCQDTSANPATIIVNPLPPATLTFANPPYVCPGTPKPLQAPAGYTYQWYLNGTPIPGATAATHGATTAGAYTVMVTNPQTTCRDSSPSIQLMAGSTPNATTTVQGTSPLCAGQPFSISAIPGYQYQWRNNNTPIPGANSATYNVTASGNYTVHVTDILTGCKDTSAIHPVQVNQQGIAAFNASSNGLSATFTFTGFSTQPPLWDFGDGSPAQTGTNPTHTYPQNGTYLVCVTAYGTFGCDSTICAPTSILVGSQQPAQPQPILYPNPANGQVQLILPDAASYQHLTLIDAQGRQRIQIPLHAPTTTLHLQEIPAGPYFLRLSSHTQPPKILHLIIQH